MLENSNHATLRLGSASTGGRQAPQAQLQTGQLHLEKPHEQKQVGVGRFPYRVFDSTHAIAAFRSAALAEQFIRWCREP